MTPPQASAPPVRRPLTGGIIVGAVLAVLALVSVPVREGLFRWVAETAERSPLSPAVAAVAEYGLLVLVAIVGGVGLWAVLRDRAAVKTLVLAGVGVVVAYGLSEGIKLLVQEDRPCSVVDAVTVLACPGEGDWSWPSNHATLAGAAAAAIAVTAPRLLAVVAPVALLVAGARVAGGVHYAHDVLSGLALGTLVVVLVVTVGRHARAGQHQPSPAPKGTHGG